LKIPFGTGLNALKKNDAIRANREDSEDERKQTGEKAHK
jgi:hypothetical protein